MAALQPTLVRLEYLAPDGSWIELAVHNLLYPDRYPVRLEQSGKVGRAVEVGGRKRTWTSNNVPADPSVLVPTTEGGPIPWRLPRASDACCAHCSEAHDLPHDGRCLL